MEYIDINLLKPDPDQPRQVFDPVKMHSLKESVKEKTILDPLTVERIPNSKHCLIIDGERRYKVAKELNIQKVPVEKMDPMTPQERMITRFHLQEQHQSWTPFDKARAIYFFMKSEGLSASQIADLLGVSHDTVSHWIGILSLSKKTQIKSIVRRIPFTYLEKIANISRRYAEITDMSKGKIEEKLLEKIENRAIYKHVELTTLLRFMVKEGNEEKKMEFLNKPDYTVKNLLGKTPEGQSIEVDFLTYRCQSTTRKLKEFTKKGYHKVLNEKQSLILRELKKAIEDLID